MNELPLVSCIMPTRNRTKFLARSIACFLSQDYPRKQLCILEDESASLDSVHLPVEVVYTWSSLVYTSIGAKRNAMCERVDGALVAHWDDDDWHSPRRLSTQIELMLGSGARLCGADRLVFYDGKQARLFQTVRKPWLAGGTLVYERSLWQEQPFIEVSDGEDTAFIDAAYRRGVKMATVSDPSLYVGMLHGANTAPKYTDKMGGFDTEQVRKWIERA